MRAQPKQAQAATRSPASPFRSRSSSIARPARTKTATPTPSSCRRSSQISAPRAMRSKMAPRCASSTTASLRLSRAASLSRAVFDLLPRMGLAKQGPELGREGRSLQLTGIIALSVELPGNVSHPANFSLTGNIERPFQRRLTGLHLEPHRRQYPVRIFQSLGSKSAGPRVPRHSEDGRRRCSARRGRRAIREISRGGSGSARVPDLAPGTPERPASHLRAIHHSWDGTSCDLPPAPEAGRNPRARTTA